MEGRYDVGRRNSLKIFQELKEYLKYNCMKNILINDSDSLHSIKFELLEGSGDEERKISYVEFMAVEASITETGDKKPGKITIELHYY